jgi:hypothetical protein
MLRWVFERFTERARLVTVFAQEEARALKHDYIGTEHVLLGLLRQEEGLAARVLESLGITVERVRDQVVRIVGSGGGVISGQIPFAPRTKTVLEHALREALSLQHDYVQTEDILLGLVRENEGVAARIMLDFDAAPEKVRREVGRMAGPRGARRPVPLAPIFAERLCPEVADPEDASTLAGQFQLRCRELILETIEAGFTPGVWIGLINTMGAVDAAKDLLSRGQVLPVTPWLVEHGRTELTMEHELTQMRWAELFTDEDRAEATRRLASASDPDA